MAREPRYCKISGPECEAPAGYRTGDNGIIYGDKSTKTTCYKCGEPVCKKCSHLVQRRRICETCAEEHKW